jgi:hypothetical protein
MEKLYYQELSHSECLAINGGSYGPGDFLKYLATGLGWLYTTIKEILIGTASIAIEAYADVTEGLQEGWEECPVSVQEWN